MKRVLRNGLLEFLWEPLREVGNDGNWRDETEGREWKDVFLKPMHVGFSMT